MQAAFRALLLALLADICLGQPFVYYRGVVNAGSYLAPAMPNGGVSRGSMFTIFGRGLGPLAGESAQSFPLQASLSGVSVELTQNSNQVRALPVYVSAVQLNAILPSNTPIGLVSLRVIYNGQSSNPVPVRVVNGSVGLFAVNGAGFGPGIVQNVVSEVERPINSLKLSARPGQTAIVWGTGLGAATFSDAIAPPAGNIDSALEVFVGGKKASVSYAGRSPCCASIDQMAFVVPNDVPAGCYVPLVVRSRSGVVSNTVTMAIHPTGAACSDPTVTGKVAIGQLARESLRVDLGNGGPYDVVRDLLLASFRSVASSDYVFNPLLSLPPAGTCQVYAGSADRLFKFASAYAPPGGQISGASPLTIDAPGRSVNIQNVTGMDASFFALLGLQNPFGSQNTPLLLDRGPFGLASSGSVAISAFRSVIEAVSALNWTNRDTIGTVDRTKELTLNWSGSIGSGRGVLVTGMSQSIGGNATAAFVCVAPPGANSFTVPVYVLAALPASDSYEYFPSARISIVNAPLSSGPTIPGFDSSSIGISVWGSKIASMR